MLSFSCKGFKYTKYDEEMILYYLNKKVTISLLKIERSTQKEDQKYTSLYQCLLFSKLVDIYECFSYFYLGNCTNHLLIETVFRQQLSVTAPSINFSIIHQNCFLAFLSNRQIVCDKDDRLILNLQ